MILNIKKIIIPIERYNKSHKEKLENKFLLELDELPHIPSFLSLATTSKLLRLLEYK